MWQNRQNVSKNALVLCFLSFFTNGAPHQYLSCVFLFSLWISSPMLLQRHKAKATQTNCDFQAHVGLWYCTCVFYLTSQVLSQRFTGKVGSKSSHWRHIFNALLPGVWFSFMQIFIFLVKLCTFFLSMIFLHFTNYSGSFFRPYLETPNDRKSCVLVVSPFRRLFPREKHICSCLCCVILWACTIVTSINILWTNMENTAKEIDTVLSWSGFIMCKTC